MRLFCTVVVLLIVAFSARAAPVAPAAGVGRARSARQSVVTPATATLTDSTDNTEKEAVGTSTHRSSITNRVKANNNVADSVQRRRTMIGSNRSTSWRDSNRKSESKRDREPTGSAIMTAATPARGTNSFRTHDNAVVMNGTNHGSDRDHAKVIGDSAEAGTRAEIATTPEAQVARSTEASKAKVETAEADAKTIDNNDHGSKNSKAGEATADVAHEDHKATVGSEIVNVTIPLQSQLQPHMRPVRVAIIGAGLAGLATALAIKDILTPRKSPRATFSDRSSSAEVQTDVFERSSPPFTTSTYQSFDLDSQLRSGANVDSSDILVSKRDRRLSRFGPSHRRSLDSLSSRANISSIDPITLLSSVNFAESSHTSFAPFMTALATRLHVCSQTKMTTHHHSPDDRYQGPLSQTALTSVASSLLMPDSAMKTVVPISTANAIMSTASLKTNKVLAFLCLLRGTATATAPLTQPAKTQFGMAKGTESNKKSNDLSISKESFDNNSSSAATFAHGLLTAFDLLSAPVGSYANNIPHLTALHGGGGLALGGGLHASVNEELNDINSRVHDDMNDDDMFAHSHSLLHLQQSSVDSRGSSRNANNNNIDAVYANVCSRYIATDLGKMSSFTDPEALSAISALFTPLQWSMLSSPSSYTRAAAVAAAAATSTTRDRFRTRAQDGVARAWQAWGTVSSALSRVVCQLDSADASAYDASAGLSTRLDLLQRVDWPTAVTAVLDPNVIVRELARQKSHCTLTSLAQIHKSRNKESSQSLQMLSVRVSNFRRFDTLSQLWRALHVRSQQNKNQAAAATTNPATAIRNLVKASAPQKPAVITTAAGFSINPLLLLHEWISHIDLLRSLVGCENSSASSISHTDSKATKYILPVAAPRDNANTLTSSNAIASSWLMRHALLPLPSSLKHSFLTTNTNTLRNVSIESKSRSNQSGTINSNRVSSSFKCDNFISSDSEMLELLVKESGASFHYNTQVSSITLAASSRQVVSLSTDTKDKMNSYKDNLPPLYSLITSNALKGTTNNDKSKTKKEIVQNQINNREYDYIVIATPLSSALTVIKTTEVDSKQTQDDDRGVIHIDPRILRSDRALEYYHTSLVHMRAHSRSNPHNQVDTQTPNYSDGRRFDYNIERSLYYGYTKPSARADDGGEPMTVFHDRDRTSSLIAMLSAAMFGGSHKTYDEEKSKYLTSPLKYQQSRASRFDNSKSVSQSLRNNRNGGVQLPELGSARSLTPVSPPSMRIHSHNIFYLPAVTATASQSALPEVAETVLLAAKIAAVAIAEDAATMRVVTTPAATPGKDGNTTQIQSRTTTIKRHPKDLFKLMDAYKQSKSRRSRTTNSARNVGELDTTSTRASSPLDNDPNISATYANGTNTSPRRSRLHTINASEVNLDLRSNNTKTDFDDVSPLREAAYIFRQAAFPTSPATLTQPQYQRERIISTDSDSVSVTHPSFSSKSKSKSRHNGHKFFRRNNNTRAIPKATANRIASTAAFQYASSGGASAGARVSSIVSVCGDKDGTSQHRVTRQDTSGNDGPLSDSPHSDSQRSDNKRHANCCLASSNAKINASISKSRALTTASSSTRDNSSLNVAKNTLNNMIRKRAHSSKPKKQHLCGPVGDFWSFRLGWSLEVDHTLAQLERD